MQIASHCQYFSHKGCATYYYQNFCYCFFFVKKKGAKKCCFGSKFGIFCFLLVNLLFKKGTLLKTTILILAMFDRNVFRFDILKILCTSEMFRFYHEALLNAVYHVTKPSRNRVKTMIQTLYTLNCTQNQSYISQAVAKY